MIRVDVAEGYASALKTWIWPVLWARLSVAHIK